MSDGAWRALIAQTADGQGEPGRTFHLDLGAQPTEVRHARTFLRARLAPYPQLPLDMVLLLASELITNAMLHGRSRIALDFCVFGRTVPAQGAALPDAGATVLVAVTDESPNVPRQQRRSRSQEGGRGLQIVRELADEWGWLPLEDAPGKIVWFRLRTGSVKGSTRRKRNPARGGEAGAG
jgi:anti-sigma regulatory factor (Ser/Thr protein kinase)